MQSVSPLPPASLRLLSVMVSAANIVHSDKQHGMKGRGGIRKLGISDRWIDDDLAHAMRAELTELTRDPEAYRGSRLAGLQSRLARISVKTTLVLRHGQLDHEHYYEFPTDDDLLALCVGFLCDSRLPGDAIRQCKLTECGRFFERNGKRLFCPDRDCADIYDMSRAATYRVPKSRERAAKHKQGEGR